MPETRRDSRRHGFLALLLLGLASLGALLLRRLLSRRREDGVTGPTTPTCSRLSAEPDAAAGAGTLTAPVAVPPRPSHGLSTAVQASREPFVALAALGLAALTPGLVVADRWLGVAQVRALGRDAWCTVDLLCTSFLPGYFVYGVPALVACALLLLVCRNLPPLTDRATGPCQGTGLGSWQPAPASRAGRTLRVFVATAIIVIAVAGLGWGRVPGWDYVLVLALYVASQFLDEAPGNATLDRLRLHAPGWLSRASALLGLSLFLAAVTGDWGWRGVLGLALLVPLVVRWVQRDRPSAAFSLVAALTVLYTIGIDSWKYSVIGDEYSFFVQARTIAMDHGLLGMGSRLFSGRAVYGVHPYFSSVIHAVSMMLLGPDNFGWRFSNGFLMALSTGLLYRFWSGFLSRRAALVAAVLFGTSHYLINFSKIGYNNVQALFAVAVVLWTSGCAVRTPTRLTLTGLGLAMGLCLYVYPAALYALPLPVALLLFFLPRGLRWDKHLWALVLAAFGLMVVPLLFQGKYWRSKVAGTLFNNASIVATPASTLRHVALNSLYSSLAYAYSPEETHFVAASHMDPIAAVFFPVGAFLTFRRVRKDRLAAFLGLAFLLELILVGVTHDRRTPPATRMFMLMPWWSVLTSLGILWVLDQFRLLSSNRWPIVVVMSLIVGMNLYQAFGLLRQRYEGWDSLEVLFLRLVQRDARLNPDHDKLYLFLAEPGWDIDGLRLLRDVYGVPRSQELLVRVAVETPLLGPDVVSTIQRENTVVIIQPSMEEGSRRSLEATLRQLGKKECQVRAGLLTRVVFSLWLSPGCQDLCWRANLPW